MPDPPGRDEYNRARHASPLQKYEHIAKFRRGRACPTRRSTTNIATGAADEARF